jgi:hypothetical protein
MSCIRPDGSAVDRNSLPVRQRHGRRLSDEQVRQVSDAVFYLLTDTLALSPLDARRVMARRIGERAIRHRQGEMRPVARKIGVLGLLAEVARATG